MRWCCLGGGSFGLRVFPPYPRWDLVRQSSWQRSASRLWWQPCPVVVEVVVVVVLGRQAPSEAAGHLAALAAAVWFGGVVLAILAMVRLFTSGSFGKVLRQ